MRFLIASDLHGSAYWCEKLLHAYGKEETDRILFLGDILYHGPRNHLPERYDTFAVTKMLNGLNPAPACVRGNCDAEVDQMVLQFPMMADYMLLPLDDGKIAFVTHGHLYNIECPPPHKPGDVLIHGHTHVHGFFPQTDYTYINPGSAALPKEEQVPSYMVYDNGVFFIKNLDTAEVLKTWSI